MSNGAGISQTWLSAALLAALPLVALGQDENTPTFRLLVESGAAVAGRADTFVRPTFSRDVIALDREGRALFDALLENENREVQSLVAAVVADGTTVRAIFAIGDAAPSGGIDAASSTINFLGDEMFLSPAGDVLAKVELGGGKASGEALLIEVGGVAQVAVAGGVAFPGVCGLSDIGNGISTRQFAVNGDALVFHGASASSLCGDDGRVVYRVTGGDPASALAVQGGGVPGRPGEEFDGLFTGTALGEGGAYAFAARFRDSGTAELVSVLLLADPRSGLIPLSSSRTPARGTGLVTNGFAAWRVGQPPQGELPQRVAWVASASADPDDFGLTSEHVVYDTAHGADPVLRTGTVVDGFTFDAVARSVVSIGIALAGEDQLIVVGETSGPGVPEGGAAVWRAGSQFDPPLGVVLHEGGPVPGDDPRAAGRTITRLLTVNLNEQGRLVAECELSTGSQAILMEESGAANAGRFRIAVLLRDTLPTSDGTGEAFGLLSELPSFPRVLGSGESGLQSRFNASGEFVFRARIDPGGTAGSRTSLYTVALGPPREKCDVTARQKGGNLSITGGDGDCVVTIHSLTGGAFQVVPGADTTVNGENTTASFTGVTGSVAVRMGDGDDQVTLDSTDTACGENSPTDVSRNLVVDTGDGTDVLRITGLEIRGSVTIRSGSAGAEQLVLSESCVHRNLKLLGGAHRGTTDVTTCVVEGTTKFTLPGGPDRDSAPVPFVVVGSQLGKTIVKGSAASDELRFERCVFDGPVRIDPRGGVVEDLRVTDCEFDASVRVNAKASGNFVSRWTDAQLTGGGLRIDTGNNGCSVTLLRCSVDGKAEFRTRAAAVGEALNSIDIENSILESALVLKGKGSHAFTVGAGSTVHSGISVNTKRGASDMVNVADTRIDAGSLVVKSSAAAFVGRFNRLTIPTGDVRVRGGNGGDEVFLTDSTLSGFVNIALQGGDDVVELNGNTIGRDLRLFGGSGGDVFRNGTEAANTVSGATVIDSFEGGVTKAAR